MTQKSRNQEKMAQRMADQAVFMGEREAMRRIEHERDFYYAKALYERDKDKALEKGDLTPEDAAAIEAKIAEVEKEIKDYHDNLDKA